jgi:hypothetical protein
MHSDVERLLDLAIFASEATGDSSARETAATTIKHKGKSEEWHVPLNNCNLKELYI